MKKVNLKYLLLKGAKIVQKSYICEGEMMLYFVTVKIFGFIKLKYEYKPVHVNSLESKVIRQVIKGTLGRL